MYSCELWQNFQVILLSDRLLVSANKNVLIIGNRNIGKIPYQCIASPRPRLCPTNLLSPVEHGYSTVLSDKMYLKVLNWLLYFSQQRVQY